MKPALASASGPEKHKANVHVGTLKCDSGPKASYTGKDILEGREGGKKGEGEMHQSEKEGKRREGKLGRRGKLNNKLLKRTSSAISKS